MRNLREIRQARNMSQQTLADLIGVKRAALSMWEIDKAEPDIATIVKLCNILNVTADELLGISIKKRPEIDGKFLDDDEIEIIRDYRKCRQSFKESIKNIISNLSKVEEETEYDV